MSCRVGVAPRLLNFSRKYLSRRKLRVPERVPGFGCSNGRSHGLDRELLVLKYLDTDGARSVVCS